MLCICDQCGKEKRAQKMYSPKLCNCCQAKQAKKSQANELARNRTLRKHAHMRVNGLICSQCQEHRDYKLFPVNAKTGRIMELKPCFICRSPKNVCTSCQRTVQKGLIAPHKLCYDCNQARLEAMRRMKRCGMCSTMKQVTDFENDMPFCRDCAKVFAVHTCKTCEQEYQTPDMMPPARDECIYCVARRNNREDMIRLREIMRRDKVVSSKIADFAKQEYKKFLT